MIETRAEFRRPPGVRGEANRAKRNPWNSSHRSPAERPAPNRVQKKLPTNLLEGVRETPVVTNPENPIGAQFELESPFHAQGPLRAIWRHPRKMGLDARRGLFPFLRLGIAHHLPARATDLRLQGAVRTLRAPWNGLNSGESQTRLLHAGKRGNVTG